MASEREENKNNSSEVVEHFYSPVVEVIALISSLVNSNQHEFAEATHKTLLKEITEDSKEFINEWQNLTDWDFTELYNFLLPYPFFNDIEQFLQKLTSLSKEKYLFFTLAEEIPISQIEKLVKNPTSIDSFDVHYYWETTDKRNFVVQFIKDMDNIRVKTANLLREISQSKAFLNSIQENMQTYENSIKEIKSLKMAPLNLAQYVMGKTFRRTSLYKMYYFIPSYFFTPHRGRIFNSEICIVIYGCAKPLSDTRETSADYESKLKALSDRNRLLMLHMLAGKKEYGAKLAEYLGITTATISHHLEILKKAGFVKEEKVGNIKYFSCEKKFTADFLEELTLFLSSRNKR